MDGSKRKEGCNSSARFKRRKKKAKIGTVVRSNESGKAKADMVVTPFIGSKITPINEPAPSHKQILINRYSTPRVLSTFTTGIGSSEVGADAGVESDASIDEVMGAADGVTGVVL